MFQELRASTKLQKPATENDFEETEESYGSGPLRDRGPKGPLESRIGLPSDERQRPALPYVKRNLDERPEDA